MRLGFLLVFHSHIDLRNSGMCLQHFRRTTRLEYHMELLAICSTGENPSHLSLSWHALLIMCFVPPGTSVPGNLQPLLSLAALLAAQRISDNIDQAPWAEDPTNAFLLLYSSAGMKSLE